MLNVVALTGRLTRDVELKYTQGGDAVCRFTLAVNRPFKNANGENEADFVNCTAWRKTAETMSNFLSKGSLVGVEGAIRTGSYEKDGQRIFTTEVNVNNFTFLETKREAEQNRTAQQTQPTQQPQARTDNPFAPKTNNTVVDVSDDDLPF